MQNHSESIKYGLALHTSTPELGLAMSNFAGDARSSVWNLERSLSSHIHQYIVDFIRPHTWEDFSLIAVAKGPGGFTGTRIGVVTARTLGQQLGIPVFAISNLAAIAWSYAKSVGFPPECESIAVEMTAQRGQIFAGIYQATPSEFKVILADSAMSPEKWSQTKAQFNGHYKLIKAESEVAASVTSVLELAYLDWCQNKHPDWSEALPFYGQHPVEL